MAATEAGQGGRGDGEVRAVGDGGGGPGRRLPVRKAAGARAKAAG